jgi:hypothetical protein
MPLSDDDESESVIKLKAKPHWDRIGRSTLLSDNRQSSSADSARSAGEGFHVPQEHMLFLNLRNDSCLLEALDLAQESLGDREEILARASCKSNCFQNRNEISDVLK